MTPDSFSSSSSDEVSTLFSVLLVLTVVFILVGIGLFAWELIVDYKAELTPPAAIFSLLPLR